MKRLIALACLLGIAMPAAGDDETGAAVWSGEGELGYVTASGNTDSTTLNARLEIGRKLEAWDHTARLRVIRAEADGDDNADRKIFRSRSEYALGDKSYLFGALRYEDDKFSGFDFQASITFGAGRTFVDSAHHRLEASIGLGPRRLRDIDTREDDDDVIVDGQLGYEYRLSDNATFKQGLLVQDGSENTLVESLTSLDSQINGNLSMNISYLVKRNSQVPDGTDKTDKLTTVSLIYGF